MEIAGRILSSVVQWGMLLLAHLVVVVVVMVVTSRKDPPNPNITLYPAMKINPSFSMTTSIALLFVLILVPFNTYNIMRALGSSVDVYRKGELNTVTANYYSIPGCLSDAVLGNKIASSDQVTIVIPAKAAGSSLFIEGFCQELQ